jgi:hypothetical protein
LKVNHGITKEVDQGIVVKSHFPSPELDEDIQQDFQQNKVLQSCFSSPMNDVVVQILSGLDMDEGSETASMEISSSEQTNDIEFQESNKTVYATVQSEIQKMIKRWLFYLVPLKIMVLKMHWELQTVKWFIC